MAKTKERNTASIGFEEEIWAAANKLRGNLDASEYKSVVLGLIFLKYISDKFEDVYFCQTGSSYIWDYRKKHNRKSTIGFYAGYIVTQTYVRRD